jgi:hypothetical protein
VIFYFPNVVFDWNPLYFCELVAHAKFWNPTTTPAMVLTTVSREEEEQKIT